MKYIVLVHGEFLRWKKEKKRKGIICTFRAHPCWQFCDLEKGQAILNFNTKFSKKQKTKLYNESMVNQDFRGRS